jgi:type I restriction-modification system DNA methylase subunit
MTKGTTVNLVAQPPSVSSVKENLTNALVLIYRHEGYHMYDCFRFLIAYLGKELGLHNEPLQLNQVTIKGLKRHINLDALKSVQFDVLGEIFMEQNLGNAAKGQFFTPTEVVRLMVAMNPPEPGETVLDPACGSGRFLIEAGKYTESLYGVEIDLWTYRMCLINMALYAPTAKILWGDALMLPGIGRHDHHIWAQANQW